MLDDKSDIYFIYLVHVSGCKIDRDRNVVRHLIDIDLVLVHAFGIPPIFKSCNGEKCKELGSQKIAQLSRDMGMVV